MFGLGLRDQIFGLPVRLAKTDRFALLGTRPLPTHFFLDAFRKLRSVGCPRVGRLRDVGWLGRCVNRRNFGLALPKTNPPRVRPSGRASVNLDIVLTPSPERGQ